MVRKGKYAGLVHDGPEYETGTMFGANLLISDLSGLTKAIFDGDDYGMDIISAGNVIGFLMEAYEKKYIDKKFLDGIDLRWGDVDAVRRMIKKIAYRDGAGDLAAMGVKALSKKIGRDSGKFAVHVKGLELAAWNVQANPSKGVCYVASNRGACHMNGDNVDEQNFTAIIDSLGICMFASDHGRWYVPGIGSKHIGNLLTAITGIQWTEEKLLKACERIFNLERMFNYREGFQREDDNLPDRFFEDSFTIGYKEGEVLDRDKFGGAMDSYYEDRGWNTKTSKPGKSRLEDLGLSFTLEG